MITFGIGGFGYDESVLRAKFDAEPAALAPLLNDVDNAARYLDALFIKGLSPRGHDRSFTKVKSLRISQKSKKNRMIIKNALNNRVQISKIAFLRYPLLKRFDPSYPYYGFGQHSLKWTCIYT
jgi:hypothetical protein